MFFKIAETREERKQIAKYYDDNRKEMAKFRDEIDSISENKYNDKILERSRMIKEPEEKQPDNVNVNPPEQQEIVSNPPSPSNDLKEPQEFEYLEYVKNKVKRAYWSCGF